MIYINEAVVKPIPVTNNSAVASIIQKQIKPEALKQTLDKKYKSSFSLNSVSQPNKTITVHSFFNYENAIYFLDGTNALDNLDVHDLSIQGNPDEFKITLKRDADETPQKAEEFLVYEYSNDSYTMKLRFAKIHTTDIEYRDEDFNVSLEHPYKDAYVYVMRFDVFFNDAEGENAYFKINNKSYDDGDWSAHLILKSKNTYSKYPHFCMNNVVSIMPPLRDLQSVLKTKKETKKKNIAFRNVDDIYNKLEPILIPIYDNIEERIRKHYSNFKEKIDSTFKLSFPYKWTNGRKSYTFKTPEEYIKYVFDPNEVKIAMDKKEIDKVVNYNIDSIIYKFKLELNEVIELYGHPESMTAEEGLNNTIEGFFFTPKGRVHLVTFLAGDRFQWDTTEKYTETGRKRQCLHFRTKITLLKN